MKTLDTIFKATLTFSHAAILCVIGAECIDTLKSRHKRKQEEKLKKFLEDDLEDDEDEDYSWDDDEFEIEPYVPELTSDALQHLKPARISTFVREKMFPEALRTLAHMTMDERYMAEKLLISYIGFILDAAPDTEKDFCVLLELLENSVVPRDSEYPSVTEMVLEDSKKQEGESRFYEVYRFFKDVCTDPGFIIHCCSEIVSVIVVKLYGYIPASADGISFAAGGNAEYDTE